MHYIALQGNKDGREAGVSRAVRMKAGDGMGVVG
jgi:hypothetical protein